jgi:hypothetical protein
MSVSLVARQEGGCQPAVPVAQAGTRRRTDSRLGWRGSGAASELAAARAEIAKLQRVLGKKTLENEILRKQWSTPPKKWIARSPLGRGRPVKAVCVALGLARSNIHRLHARPESWGDARTRRTEPASDAILLDEIKAQITELPTYGYRRACALVNRQRPKLVRSESMLRCLSRDGRPCIVAAEGAQTARFRPPS